MAGGYRVSIADVFEQEGYFSLIAENLMNPAILKTARAKVTQMSLLLYQLNELINVQSTMQASHYAKASLRRSMSQWGGLSGQLADRTELNKQQISITQSRQLVIQLYTLEREIIQLLIGNAAATTDYAVYYYSDKDQKTITRASLSAEKLYKSEYLQLNKNGGLMLKKQAVFDKEMWSDSSGPDDIIQAYKNGANSLSVFEEMMGTISTYFEQLSDEYKELSDIASREHLGKERDAKYDVLRALVTQWGSVSTFNGGLEQQALKFVQIFMPNNIDPSLAITVSQRINRGHLTEAFERIYQNYLTTGRTQELTGEIFINALQESLGHDPWYAKGDVGTTQVKSFLNDSTEIRIASLYSIVELAQWFIGLVTQFINKTSMPNTIAKVKQELKASMSQGDKILDSSIEGTLDDLLEDFYSMF